MIFLRSPRYNQLGHVPTDNSCILLKYMKYRNMPVSWSTGGSGRTNKRNETVTDLVAVAHAFSISSSPSRSQCSDFSFQEFDCFIHQTRLSSSSSDTAWMPQKSLRLLTQLDMPSLRQVNRENGGLTLNIVRGERKGRLPVCNDWSRRVAAVSLDRDTSA
jgi:hypothetical protein